MNEKRIEQVLEIEKQAQAILDAATREADQLPARAEQEAQAMIAQVRADAEAEARQDHGSGRGGRQGKRHRGVHDQNQQ